MKFTLCPVCGQRAQSYTDYTEYAISEDGEDCGNCGYSFNFSYGYYRVIVGRRTFTWYYKTPEEQVRRINKLIDKAIELRKRELGVVEAQ